MYVYYVYFKIGTAVANPDRRHQLRFVWSHDDGPIEHEGKPRRELYEKADKQADIPDVALFLDEREKLEKRSTPCHCDPACNPCVKTMTQNNECICQSPITDGKLYCMPQQKDSKNCEVNTTWLFEHLTFTYSPQNELKMMCQVINDK